MAIERQYPGEIPVSGLAPTGVDDEMGRLIELPEEADPYAPEDPLEMPESPSAVAQDFYANLAEFIDERELRRMGLELLSDVEADRASMKEWEDILVDGLKLLGFKLNDREAEVFPDSCTVSHPILAESIVKYQAKARSQILRPEGTARTKVLGRSDPQRKAQAERVKDFINYQIQEQMPEYGPEHDRMLFHQALAGSAYTKLYYDTALSRPSSRFVGPRKFFIDYNATDLESAYRYTEEFEVHVNDMRRFVLDGFYLDTDLQTMPAASAGRLQEEIDSVLGRNAIESSDEAYSLYEIHTYLALEGEIDDRNPREQEIGLELPYIITVDQGSGKVISIRRNWKQGDPRYKKRVWYTHWPFIPGLGFQGYGYVHLVGGLARTATSSLRQLVDAGSFATLQGGFKAHGLRVIGNNEPIAPGEWRDVQAPGMDLDKALKPLPYKEPSATLFNLLGFIVEAAQKFADSTEQVVSESTNYGPVGTTMALLEASGRLFSGIHERLFESQKRELQILIEINAETLPDKYPFPVAGGDQVIAKADFDARLDVIPVTDPREPTAAHRVARANATLSVAQQFPQHHHMPAVLEDLHGALGAEDPQRYLVHMQPKVPKDPVTENAEILKGAPAYSFLEEHHMAHIKVHLMLIENELYNKNPQVIQAVMAHVQEHLAHQFQVDMMKQGVQPAKPPQDPNQPPEQAQQMQQQIAQNNQIAVAAAQAVEQIVSDPSEEDTETAIKLAELSLKQAEQRRKDTETALRALEANRDFQLKRRDQFQEMEMHEDDVKVEYDKMETQEKIARMRPKGGNS